MGQISVTVDEDIYDMLLSIKGSSKVSISQCANRLMRAGMNYGTIGSIVTDTEHKVDSVMDLLASFVESQGQGQLLDEIEYSEAE